MEEERWEGARRSAWLALFAALVACSPMQDDIAEVGHRTDFDDGSAILAEFAVDEGVSVLSGSPGRYILSRNGAIRNLEAFVRRQGDTLDAYAPVAGFAVVETDSPGAYRRFADVVVRDVVIDWREPTTTVAFARSAGFVPDEELQYGLPDPFSHGTHVAGTIAAAQSDFGVIGVAPDAELVLIKVLSDAGSGAFSWVAEGMIHAADVGSDIANLSFGASFPQRGFETEDGTWVSAREVAELRVLMQRVTNYGTWKGTLYVTSAGNSAYDRDKTADLLVLRADIHRMVSVSATAPIGWATDPLNTFLENLASNSNYGRSAIDVSAPGGDFVYPGAENCTVAGLLRPCWVFDLVFGTGNEGWYWSAGTSMAAPHASGVVALILSETPSLKGNPARLEQELYRRAADLGRAAAIRSTDVGPRAAATRRLRPPSGHRTAGSLTGDDEGPSHREAGPLLWRGRRATMWPT